eukprot:6256026-Prymnesium_polylepis.2
MGGRPCARRPSGFTGRRGSVAGGIEVRRGSRAVRSAASNGTSIDKNRHYPTQKPTSATQMTAFACRPRYAGD